MEWLTSILEGKVQGDALNEIVEAVKKEMPLHSVPKHKYNEVAEAKKSLDEALKERDKQLNDLKSNTGDYDALKQKIEELQTQNKESKSAYEAKIKDIQVSTAVETALKDSKAKHIDLLLGKIDKSLLSVGEDGKLTGLDTQLETLKTSYADLFEVSAPAKPAVQGFVPVNQTGSNTSQGALTDGAKLAQMFNQNAQAVSADPWKI